MKQVGLKDRLNGWMAQITVALSNIDNDDVTGRALCIAQVRTECSYECALRISVFMYE